MAAGGGSILHFDGARFRVGPDSAGANPGPACYRRGGPLAVTDANVMVGKLHAGLLPEDVRRQAGPAARRRRRAATPSRDSPTESATAAAPEEVADGFIKIAVENMANAIKKISVQRGYDVTRYALNCFGGAGGQHACLVADALGMTTVLIHPFSALLSAYGMGLADIRATRQQAIEEAARRRVARRRSTRSASGSRKDVERRSRRPGRADEAHHGASSARTSATTAPTPRWSSKAGDRSPAHEVAAFETAHKAQFGFIDRRQAARRRGRRRSRPIGGGASSREPKREHRARSCLARAAHASSSPTAPGTTPASIAREQLAPGHKVNGPAIIIEPHQTIVVEPGWQAADHRARTIWC